MNLIGFDFGTTNSTISFYNTETKTLDCFQPSASSADYIPTVVAYKDNEVCIGNIAKKNITKKGYESYEYFKLRLGSDANTVIENKTKTPTEVTADYIRELLTEYRRVQNIDSIDGVVMTVPETWFREESNRTARENIEKIYEELGYDIESQFQLESEPVAAAGYFCWAYEHSKEKNPQGGKFNGFITVVDYGGGTLDVTLCKVESGSIKILERCGYGEYNRTNGCAGVAFDEAVIEKLCNDNDIKLDKTDRKFIKLRDAFEKEKITETKHITEMMQLYYNDPSIVEDEVLLTLEYDDDELCVYCKDLAECFEKINKPVLDESLSQMQAYFATHGVDSANQDEFKVLLVGGFSNFYCVEETVRQFFGSRYGLNDKRFDQVFTLNNKSLAIAKGAALIAQKVVKVDHACTHNIGYIAVRPDDQDRWIDTDVIIIKKGMKVSKAKEPIYAPNKVQVRLKSGIFRIFLDDGRENSVGRTQAALDQSVGEIFPNMDDISNEYQIGFSVDKNLIPTLHVRDKNGAEKQIRLNSLLSRIAVREKSE
ncbi:MAG: Hsp70 family protein [Clostridia bacterium]|nr:Hsp70 family protein [Clostridia bacterium]